MRNSISHESPPQRAPEAEDGRMSKRLADSGLRGLLLVLLLLGGGCRGAPKAAPPPRETYTLPIERRDFRGTVEETWAAALKAIEASGGIIILKDKETNRIVYSLYHKPSRQRFELSVLIKDLFPRYGIEATAVFLGVRARRRGDYSMVVNGFFDKVERNLAGR